MFILDTNILTAVMGSRPVPEVAAWIAGQPDELIFTSTICQAEILSGIAILPAGHRRRILEEAARLMFQEDFEGRILPFDSDAAEAYADILARPRQAGLSTPPFDLMIAAVARAKGAGIVTRDIGGFEGCGLTLINPWQVV